MLHTDNPDYQADVDKCNALLQKWHDFVSLEFGHYSESHMITMFGRSCEVYLVYGTEREHAYLTYNSGCTS